MIAQTDILSLLNPVIEIKKKSKRKYLKESETLEYFQGYADYVAWRDAITNHTVKGKKAYKLLEVKAPNQSQEELDYIIANYKQITLPVSFEFLATIGRGLHESNWSISYQEDAKTYIDAEMTFKKYLEVDMTETPLHMSYDSWVKFVLPSIKLNDSMGVVGFKPYRQEKTVIIDDEEVIAGDALPEPIPFYYTSDRVLSKMDWGYLLVETNQFSIVQKEGREVREGLVFELWDDQNIWIIEQYGKAHEYLFKERLYVNHSLGFIPATYLKGTPQYDDNGDIYYQSPFLMVTDLLDEVLIDGCMLRSVKASSVYPQKVMLGNDCTFVDEHGNNCQVGWIQNHDGAGKYKCTNCHGTGQLSRTSALNTLYVRGKSSIDSGDDMKPVDALAYISPDVAIPQFLRTEITQGNLNAMSILHLKTTNTTVKGTPDTTATEVAMDERGKYAFVKTVVDQIFDIGEFGLKCMGMIRYREDYKQPALQRPVSYDFNTEGDYLVQISAAQAAGAPPVVIASYVYKYLKAIFYDNPNTARAYDLIIAADRLFTMTKDQIIQELPRNLIQPWEVVLHDSALNFVAQLQRNDPNFLLQDMEAMITQLVDLAKKNTPAAPAVTPRLNPASILENANAQ